MASSLKGPQKHQVRSLRIFLTMQVVGTNDGNRGPFGQKMFIDRVSMENASCLAAAKAPLTPRPSPLLVIFRREGQERVGAGFACQRALPKEEMSRISIRFIDIETPDQDYASMMGCLLLCSIEESRSKSLDTS